MSTRLTTLAAAMNFKRIVLFAVGWTVLKYALIVVQIYIPFAYLGNEIIFPAPATKDMLARYFRLADLALTAAPFLVYLLFLRTLQTRLMAHSLALFGTLEITENVLAVAILIIAGEGSPRDILKISLGDIFVSEASAKHFAIALLAVGVVYGFRRYKSRIALKRTGPETSEAH